MKRTTVYDTEVQLKDKVQKDGFLLRSGQSIGVHSRYVGKTPPFFSKHEMHLWKVTLLCNQRTMEIDFFTGLLKHRVTAENVLGALHMEAWSIIECDYGYEDWCYEFGNDPYEPSSHFAYGMVCDQVRKLQTFLGGKVFQEFLEDPKLRGIEDE